VVVVEPQSSRCTGGHAALDQNNESNNWKRRLEGLTNRLLVSDNSEDGDPCQSTGYTKTLEEEEDFNEARGSADENHADPLLARLRRWNGGGGCSRAAAAAGTTTTTALWDERAAEVAAASRELQEQVQESVDRLSEELRKRSEHNYQLQLSVIELQATRQALVQNLEEDVESYLAECKHAMSVLEVELDQIRAEAREVLREQEEVIPRLQHSIALYLSCTGIKWYDDDLGDDEGENAEATPSKVHSVFPRQKKVWHGQVVSSYSCFTTILCCLPPMRLTSRVNRLVT
jgi:hypothetical protein